MCVNNIDRIKQIDIISVIENYTELIRSGSSYKAKENPLREEKSSSLQIYTDTQKYYDFGTGEGGDVIDFIKAVENLNTNDAISFLQGKYLNGEEIKSEFRPLPRMRNKPAKKDNDRLLLDEVETKANKYLSATLPKHTKKYDEMDLDYLGDVKSIIRISPIFEKLFEGYLIPTEKKFAEYLFSKVIGYDDYFQCPVIVIRDESETPINIIRYRPQRDGKPLMQGSKPLKYLNLRSEEVPDNNYIYPLQAQMQKIMQKEKYCFVGEGLKNVLNASLIGVPFISIEGAANIRPELIDFLNSGRMKDIEMIGAFDGDAAGEKAYKKMIDQVPMRNEFDFNSGIDFAEWLKGGEEIVRYSRSSQEKSIKNSSQRERGCQ